MQWKFHVVSKKNNYVEVVPSALVSFWKLKIVYTMLYRISFTKTSQAYEPALYITPQQVYKWLLKARKCICVAERKQTFSPPNVRGSYKIHTYISTIRTTTSTSAYKSREEITFPISIQCGFSGKLVSKEDRLHFSYC